MLMFSIACHKNRETFDIAYYYSPANELLRHFISHSHNHQIEATQVRDLLILDDLTLEDRVFLTLLEFQYVQNIDSLETKLDSISDSSALTPELLADYYYTKGLIAKSRDKAEIASNYFNKSILDSIEISSSQYLNRILEIGYTNKFKNGNKNMAERYLLKHFNLSRIIQGLTYQKHKCTYALMSLYREKSYYNKAELYAKYNFENNKLLNHFDSTKLSDSYAAYANILYEQSKLNESKNYYNKAIHIKNKIDPNSKNILFFKRNIINVFVALQDFEAADSIIQNINIESLSTKWQASFYMQKGLIESSQGEHKIAIKSYERSIDLGQKSKMNEYDFASLHNLYAESLREEKQYEQSNKALDIAKRLYGYKTDLNLDVILNYPEIIKTESLKLLNDSEINKHDYSKILEIEKQFLELSAFNEFVSVYFDNQSLLYLNEFTSYVYDALIKFELNYKKTNPINIFKYTYYKKKKPEFTEHSEFQPLLDIDKKIAIIDHSIITTDSSKIEYLNNQKNNLLDERDIVSNKLMTEHKELLAFNDLKLLDSLIHKSKNEDFSIINYHFESGQEIFKSLVISVISNGQVNYHHLNNIDSLVQSINTLIEADNASDTSKLLEKISAQIIQPIKNDIHGSKYVFVIPDGLINKISLDLLPYHSDNFLIDEFDIAYSFELEAILRYAPLKISDSDKITGIAFSNKETILNQKNKDWEELPGSFNENNLIKTTFDNQTSVYSGESATKEQFKYALENSDIINIATHATSNLNNYLLNELIFRANNKIERMSQAEILSDIKPISKLIILNACQSGKGTIFKTHGQNSISSALNTENSKVISNIWNEDDQFSQKFNSIFYQKLKEGSSHLGSFSETKRELIKFGVYSYENSGKLFFL